MQLTSLIALLLLGAAVYADDTKTATAAAVTSKTGEFVSTTEASTGKTRCTRHHNEGEYKEHKPSKFSIFHKIIADVLFESHLFDRLIAKFEQGACKHKELLPKHHEKKEEGDIKAEKVAPQYFKKIHGDKKDDDKFKITVETSVGAESTAGPAAAESAPVVASAATPVAEAASTATV